MRSPRAGRGVAAASGPGPGPGPASAGRARDMRRVPPRSAPVPVPVPVPGSDGGSSAPRGVPPGCEAEAEAPGAGPAPLSPAEPGPWQRLREQLGEELRWAASREQLDALHQEVQAGGDPGLLRQVETLVQDVAQDLQAQRLRAQELQGLLRRTEVAALAQLAELEEELQQQVAVREQQVREEEQQLLELALRGLREKHILEVAELQDGLHQLLQQEQQRHSQGSREVEAAAQLRPQLGELAQENKQLRLDLREADTSATLLQAELDRLRQELADQIRQHQREKAMLQEMMEESLAFTSRIEMLQAANRSLRDSNGALRSALQLSSEDSPRGPLSPAWRSRPGSPQAPGSPVVTYSRYRGDNDSFHQFPAVARWADRYLGRGSSGLPRQRSAASSSEGDSSLSDSGSESSEEVPSPLPEQGADAEGPRGPGGRSSKRKLPAFTPKKQEAEPMEQPPSPGPIYRLVLAGDAGAGKSSFLLRLCTNEFRGDIPTTLGVDFHMKRLLVDGERTTLQIWDTAGQERFRSIATSYFRKAHGVLLMYDVTSESSFLNVRQWIDDIQQATERPVPLMLLGNKVDLRAELPETAGVHPTHGERLALAYNALFCETSAKDGTNVVEAVLHLAREVKRMVDPSEGGGAVADLRIPGTGAAPFSCCRT
ncbi:ras and EF-hand domain-containing protein-like isoform X1 [Alligator mississippiensis]|uniref:ras and EF-hand domain-containing protein-like isoform X1 n=1 Tax=Alligator mississippiensis TaxID=8496 RepID=UPI0028772B5D|nr:ras and EF-hand domain-containing protein-like isoform X1 [Alligator mississippiensis]